MTWRPALKEERQLALLWGFAAAAGVLLREFWLSAADHLPQCAFKALTGLPCPTCGTTRAARAMLEGRLLDAFASNPLTAVLGVVFVTGGVLAPVWVAFSGPLPTIPHPLPWPLRLAAVVVILATWVYLIAVGR